MMIKTVLAHLVALFSHAPSAPEPARAPSVRRVVEVNVAVMARSKRRSQLAQASLRQARQPIDELLRGMGERDGRDGE